MYGCFGSADTPSAVVDDLGQLRDREALLDRVERRDRGIDASLAAHPVALDARKLGERVRARRDRGRDRRIGRRSRGAGDLRRHRLRLLAVMAGRVRDRADRNQQRNARHGDRGQQPGLPARAILIHHSRILNNAADAGNRY